MEHKDGKVRFSFLHKSFLNRISTDDDFSSAADADMVFEAVFEKLELKQQVFRKLDNVGNRSIETGELVFEDCRVPAKNMIG